MTKRIMALILSAVMSVGVLTGCSTDKSSADNGGNDKKSESKFKRTDKTLRLASSVSYAGIFNPVLAMDNYDRGVCEYIFESLVEINPNYEAEPMLAKSWVVSDDSKSVTFNLRDDVKWHDGVKFTANDVKFTFEFMSHPEHTSFYVSNLTPIVGYEEYKAGKADSVSGIEVLDDYTLKITTKEVFGPLLVKLGNMIKIMPKHIWENVNVAKASEETELIRNPIGTGPFKMKEFTPDQHVILDKNSEHWSGDPKIDSVVIKIMNAETIQAAALNGELDITGVPTNEDDLKSFKDAGFVTKEVFVNAFQHVSLNHKLPVFADKRVRHALTYAVNRQGIVDSVLNGYGEVANSPYPSFIWSYPGDDKLNKYEYNPEKAKKILTEEVGWTLKDGVMYNEKNEPVKFKLLCPTGNKPRELCAPIIQENLKAIGIEIEIEMMELPTMAAQMDTWEYDMALIGNSTEKDPDAKHFYHSAYIDKVQNRAAYSNPKVDELLDQGLKYVEVEKRKPYYQEFAQVLNEDMPTLMLYHWSSITALAPDLKGVTPSAVSSTYNLKNWYFEE